MSVFLTLRTTYSAPLTSCSTLRTAILPCRNMVGRLIAGTRTAFSRRLLIPWAAVPLQLPSRNPGTKSGNSTHCLANTGPQCTLSPLSPRRRYTTAPLASDHSRSPRVDRSVSELVLSDAQKRTIYALSTPPGKAGVAVIRVSGPDALDVWRGMVKGYGKHEARERVPEPWKMHRCHVVHPGSGEVLDDGLAVFFKGESRCCRVLRILRLLTRHAILGPKSFTTEDVLELHVHSGRAIVASVMNAISCFPFCRPAERGEFTRRAFEGGRLDLTQVEGIRDLIDAETESQRKVALRTAGVSVSHRGYLLEC